MTIVGWTVVASIVVGVVWGLVVPGEQLLVVAPDGGIPLTAESMHRFDAAAMFACFTAGLGAVVAVAAWTRASLRGPALVGSVLLACVLGAVVVAAVGDLVGVVRFQVPDVLTEGEIVTRGTGLGTPLVLLFAPLVASIALAVAAVLNAHDDLGSGRSATISRSPRPPAPTIPEGEAPRTRP